MHTQEVWRDQFSPYLPTLKAAAILLVEYKRFASRSLTLGMHHR